MIKFKNRKTKIILSWTGVILWMVMIFAFSAQPAKQSAGLSAKITQSIISIVDKVMPLDLDTFMTVQRVEYLHHIIRKMAHFSVYLVLGLLLVHALRQSGVKGFKIFIFALILCISYAAFDEIHQLYIPGRSGQVRDVFIDSMGALTGIAGYAMASWKVKRSK
ncbi:VanZ family protein [Irregularibacter muris]|uniref:VanZ family protein n=1 Tax=Irregularibacter muris TaxID=1796619 RepID=A0AAE3HD84_9FIRM|nr:VanZ family protein [Irregularibacter muris]MCR1898330.1 VanZ family protein [Irregularibacter muris]